MPSSFKKQETGILLIFLLLIAAIAILDTSGTGRFVGVGSVAENPIVQELTAKIDLALIGDLSEIKADGRYISAEGTVPIIIQLNDGVSLEYGKAALQKTIAAIPKSKLLLDLKIINSVSAVVDIGYIDKIVLLPEVKKVWLDEIVEIDTNESIPLINADDVWTNSDSEGINLKGNGVKIAVIDTGVDYNHADLDEGKVTLQKDFANNDNDAMDDHGHGTHVASTAAGDGDASSGQFTGVAPETNLWAIKVFNSTGSGYSSNVIAGIEWATDPNGDGLFQDRADIISMSLGSPVYLHTTSDLGVVALNKAVDRGVLPVISAGNDGPANRTINHFGGSEKSIVVGSATKIDVISSFSSRGPVYLDTSYEVKILVKPDVVAPGSNICAAQWDNRSPSSICGPKHIRMSGTSMATPHVSGAAALLKQLHPEWTPGEIKSALVMSVKDLGQIPTFQGSGRLDVLKASEVKFTTNETQISFGYVVKKSQSVVAERSLVITNKHVTSMTIYVEIAGSNIVADRNQVTIPPAGSEIIRFIFTADQYGLFQGSIRLNEGLNTYHIPYIAEVVPAPFWESDTTIVSGLSSSSNARTPTIFMKDDVLYMIEGYYPRFFSGYRWNGNIWQSDASIVNGLYATGSGYPSPEVFWIGGELYLVASVNYPVELYGFKWNGTMWVNNTSITAGLGKTPERVPTVFQIDGLNHVILDDYKNTTSTGVNGYTWNGSYWVRNITIASGLSRPCCISFKTTFYQHSGGKFLIASKYGAFTGYEWKGNLWAVNNSIIGGLYTSSKSPEVFWNDGNLYMVAGMAGTGYDGYRRGISASDISLPNGFIVINNDATYTNTRSVDLGAYCTDSDSGVKDVRYANEDDVWTNWENYATIKSWTLTSGDGSKTVKYQCRDNALNIAEKSDSIILDSTAGAVIITRPLYYHAYVTDADGGVDLNALGAPVKKPTIVGPLTIKTTVSNIGSPISKVEFLISNQLRNTDTSFPYEWIWNPTLPTELGDRTIKVKSTDSAGNITEQSIVVQVVPTAA